MEGAAFTDPFLGLVTWDDDNEWWTFDGGPIDGRPVVCYLLARQSPPPESCLEHVRQIVRWLRENESHLRRTVALGMIEWVDRNYIREPGKDQEDTLDKVEPYIHPAEVEFIETNAARINFATSAHLARMSQLSWGGGVSVAVDRMGAMVRGPEFAGRWAPERIIWPN
jgi:hypothetical protein